MTSKPWTEDEIDDLLDALDDWPVLPDRRAALVAKVKEWQAGEPLPTPKYEWLDIETAPKDQLVLGALWVETEGWVMQIARHHSDRQIRDGYWRMVGGGEPTLWHPLPAVPASAVSPSSETET